MTERTELTPLIIPLSPEAHRFAKELAAEQSTAQKRKRVYLNTLAVWAVNTYLQWMEIETDLRAGESWSPYLCGLLDAADLVLPGIGRLECRPVLPGETAVRLPPDVLEDSIGYVAVQFEEQLDRVKLLGFALPVDPDDPPAEIKIDELQPLDALTDHLERLKNGIAFLQTQEPVAEGVRQILETESLSDIVAQLERIYRTCSEFEWRFAAKKVLSGGSSTAESASREGEAVTGDIELSDLAESLMEKLAEIWGETA